VIYEATIHDQTLVARIINLAQRCGCRFRSIEAHADAPTTRVRFEFEGSDRALRLLRTQVDKLMTYDFGMTA
jgi:acetolactate synthase regulatory subunit